MPTHTQAHQKNDIRSELGGAARAAGLFDNMEFTDNGIERMLDAKGTRLSDTNPAPTSTTTASAGAQPPASEPTVGESFANTLSNVRDQALSIQDQIGNLSDDDGGTGFTSPQLDAPPTYEDIYGPAVDEEGVRSNVRRLFQSEIDATNQVFDEMLREARMEGQGRLGSQRAQAARGGILGSDFAGAQKDKVQDQNRDIRRGIEAERMAKIGSILGTARQTAADEIAAKRQARQQDAENYINFLSNDRTRRDERSNTIANALIAQGISPSEMSDEELQSIVDEAGITTSDLLAQYRAATADTGEQFTLGEGQRRFDSEGNLIAEGERGSGKIYSTSRGLVRIGADGNPQLIFGTGGGSGSGSSFEFTNSQIGKLEEAGLLNAPREQQLDFIYGDDSADEMSFEDARNFVNENLAMGRDALKSELLASGMSVSLTNSILDAAGLQSDTQVLADATFNENVSQIAEKLRKAAASITDTNETELNRAKQQVRKGTLTSNGKTFRLTPEQQTALLEELDRIGPRNFFEQVTPGGS